MSKYSLTPEILRTYLGRHPGYEAIRVFVETGTYLGATAFMAHGLFPVVHSVELSEPLYRHALHNYGATAGLHFHLGDSRAFVAEMAVELREPAVWFLDAHWFRHTRQPVAGRIEGLPLWEELAAIAARPLGDLVIMDDVHVWGRREPEPAWADVTLARVAAALPGCREAVICGPHALVYR